MKKKRRSPVPCGRKCVKLNSGLIIRTTNYFADQLVGRGLSRFVPKKLWKENGKLIGNETAILNLLGQ